MNSWNLIKNELKNMYYELQENKLHVILIPAPTPMHCGHMIRVADNNNPDWYRDLCSQYQSKAKSHKNKFKSDTKIKRQSVLSYLDQPEKHSKFKYKQDLDCIAENRLQQYVCINYKEQMYHLNDNIILQNYFNWFQNALYCKLIGKIIYIGKTGFTVIDQQKNIFSISYQSIGAILI